MKKRIEYIDAMRGFVMLLVVIGHVMFFSFELRENVYFKFLNNQLQMPLFFFISGLFVCILHNNFSYNYKSFFYNIKTKFKRLIIPLFVFLPLCDFVFQICFVDTITDFMKSGYWFTITLFEFFVIYELIIWLLSYLKLNTGIKLLIITTIALIFCFGSQHIHWLYFKKNTLWNAFGLIHFNYFIYFIGGILIKEYLDVFSELLNKPLFSGLIIFALVFEAFIADSLNTPYFSMGNVQSLIIGVCGCLIVWQFFRINENIFSKNTKIGDFLQYIGKNTLQIYFYTISFCQGIFKWSEISLKKTRIQRLNILWLF